VFICLRPLSSYVLVLGWSRNFVGSEFGQIQSVKLLRKMISNRTQHLPSPHSHTLSVHIYCTLAREKKGAVTREKGRGATAESTDLKTGFKIPR
jgi:hypothetical protein